MADICRLVRTGLNARLSDPNYGFNAKYAAIQLDYNVPAISIDWSASSTNFAWGRIPPDLVEETSPFSYPLLTISADRGQQDPSALRVRFQQFSGIVLGVVEMHLSWIEEQVIDFETWPDSVVAAMFDSINDPSTPNSWGSGLLYNGEMSFQKGPIIAAGQNWRRTLTFSCPFRVIV